MLVAATLGLLASLSTLTGQWLSAPVRDAIGAISAHPQLPVVVVRASDLGAAVRAAREAGALDVWAAFPEGDPRLSGARPDPETLRYGRDGRVRYDGDTRLPLPEALRGLTRLNLDQLGAGTPDTLLRGQRAVVVSSDPAVGRREAAPGDPAPVDRGELLAVALGVAAAGGELRSVPILVAAGLVGALATIWSLSLNRMTPLRGIALSGSLVATSLGATLLARGQGLDLPVGGLVFAAAGPLVARLGLVVRDTWHALEALRFSLASAPADPSVPTGLQALPAMVETQLLGVGAAVWRRGADGRPELLAERGEPRPEPLTQLPVATVVHPGEIVEPIREGGEVVGALCLRSASELPANAPTVAHSLANRLHAEDALSRWEPDPWLRELDAARIAALRLAARAARWEGFLESGSASLGVFGLAGELQSGSSALRALLTDPSRPPLLVALDALAAAEPTSVVAAVREVLSGAREARLPGRDERQEIVLLGLGSPPREALLLQVHDVTPHRRLDALKSSIISSASFQTRNALSAIAGYAAMMAGIEDRPRRKDLERRIRAQVDRVSGLHERAESLVYADPHTEPISPVYLRECVLSVVRALDPDRQARLSLELPEVDSPVSGRAAGLAHAIHLLLAELSEGGNTRVSLRSEAEGMLLVVDDDGGGLTEPLFQRLLGEGQLSSAPAVLRRAILEMEGSFLARSTQGVGSSFEIRLRYY